jgi:hypothetical protein
MRREAIEWVRLFEAEEIPIILGAVLRCSARLRKTSIAEREDRISDRLRMLLIQDTQLRERPIIVDREVYVYDDDQEKPTGRLDFRFLWTREAAHSRLYFAIEAKRLHVTFPSGWDSCVQKYVTDRQGMMCFIEQRYGQGLASGGMLGYVFDGDVERARISIAASIEANHEKLKTAPPFKLVLSSVLPGDSRVSETLHALAHGNFVIYHLFIAV